VVGAQQTLGIDEPFRLDSKSSGYSTIANFLLYKSSQYCSDALNSSLTQIQMLALFECDADSTVVNLSSTNQISLVTRS
jgi:hypothetical protein